MFTKARAIKRRPTAASTSKPGRWRLASVEQLEVRAMLTTFHPLQVTSTSLGILALDPSGTSVQNSGNGVIQVNNGDIYIDSTSSRAGVNSGKGYIAGSFIFVRGNVVNTGKGKILGTVEPGAANEPDPLASLPIPTPTGTSHNAVFASGTQNLTLSPGIYNGGIHVSGSAKVTLLPGNYFLNGGGLTVSGKASLTGTGVTIFNGPKSNADGISFLDSAHVNLTAASTGTYQGIVIAQTRTSKAPFMVCNTAVTLNGVVYVPGAMATFASMSVSYINSPLFGTDVPGLIADDLCVSCGGGVIVNCLGNGVTSDLSVTKVDNLGGSSITGSIGSAGAGGAITYTIVVTNSGPANVVGANVSDVFPTGVTVNSFTASQTGGATGFTANVSGNINDTVNLPTGATITYVVSATVAGNAPSTISNTATVTPPTLVTDTDPENNSATDTDTVATQGDLSITKNVQNGGTTAVPGSTVTYTIVAQNSGPSTATGAAIVDDLLTNIDVDSASFTAVGSGGASGFSTSGSGDIDDEDVTLPAGAKVTYTITATIDPTATGTLDNTATVTAPEGFTDTNPDNNSATASVTLTPQVDLTVTKVDNAGGSSVTGAIGSVNAGGTVTYTITITNSGPSFAGGVNASDFFPSLITSDRYTGTGTGTASGFTAAGTGAIADTLSLAPGDSVTYTVTATISGAAPNGFQLANTASLTPPAGVTNTSASLSATDIDLIMGENIT